MTHIPDVQEAIHRDEHSCKDIEQEAYKAYEYLAEGKVLRRPYDRQFLSIITERFGNGSELDSIEVKIIDKQMTLIPTLL